MTRSSQPTRLPADVYESASAAARIGRELEMSPQFNHRQVARVLSGASSYDALSDQEQAIVRDEWAERMAARGATLDYAAQFSSAGESYSELDEDGNLVIRAAG